MSKHSYRRTDLAPESRRGMVGDFRKFACWFAEDQHEPFVVGRVTTRDISDFRDCLRREKGAGRHTSIVCLVTVRRFLGWLAEEGRIPANPAKPVEGKLRRQSLAQRGLDQDQVRRLVAGKRELRQDVVPPPSSQYYYTAVAESAIS